MKPFSPWSASRRLADHLHKEIRSGGLDGSRPGVGTKAATASHAKSIGRIEWKVKPYNPVMR